jgi:uncharacterized UPF0160 family protein
LTPAAESPGRHFQSRYRNASKREFSSLGLLWMYWTEKYIHEDTIPTSEIHEPWE